MTPITPDPNKNRIIVQWLRSFTVSLHQLGDDKAELTSDSIVGTGIAVSTDGKIVTCAHVLEEAGIDPRNHNNAEIGVYFPQARSDERKSRRAIIAGCFPQYDDDVVLLQLKDGPAPLAPEQIAVLGYADDSFYNPFRSYGFRRLDYYIAGHAHGTIQAGVPAPDHLQLQVEPIQLESNQLDRGISGAAVLDIERNLVVGVVSEVYYPEASGRNANTAWSVNCRVLSLEPLNLPLRTEPLPLGEAPQPQEIYKETARQFADVRPESQFHTAPPLLEEWVGREGLLEGLSRDYDDPERRVTGLIGFGGEGKSSLARKWVDSLDNLANYPTGVFWWGFYDNQNVDEFFEKALEFISGGLIDPRRMAGSSAKAQVVAAMLANGRYLFVLDGLEVLQRQEGDRYGLLTSPDLQSFLELFAAPGHDSFCIVTSRAPLLDLMAYTSYTHRDVGPVSADDGRALLRELGVTGRDEALDRVVTQWGGHALTLSLLGSYLAWRHKGDVGFADEFDLVALDEEIAGEVSDEARQRYTHIHRVLRRYDEHLTEAERAFMTLFSAFRTPVAPAAFGRVFRGKGLSTDSADFTDEGDHEGTPLQRVLAGLGDGEFEGLVARLVGYRLLRHNEDKNTYTTHPLIRNHYLALLTNSDQAAQTHEQLKDYYLALAGDTPQYPTLEQLAPLIEVVYHACHAGAYDAAWDIYWQRFQAGRAIIIHILGAYETNLNILRGFFLDSNTSQEPQVSKADIKSWILNEVGLCHMSLGRLDTAVPFYERRIVMSLEIEDWREGSIGYQNLAELNAHLGRLSTTAAAAAQALELARRAAADFAECQSLSLLAFAYHLQGDTELTNKWFQEAEKSQRKLHDNIKHLYSNRGIFHAEHLLRVGETDYARQITTANLEICERNRWPDDTSRCHRVLGQLDAAEGQTAAARTHFDTALTLARSISFRPALIEALLARGRWVARSHVGAGTRPAPTEPAPETLPLQQAFSDLNEALNYATDGGYRRYEADIRIALAWAHLAAGNVTAARQEATRAQTMSEEMGYHWGLVDAGEVSEQLAVNNGQ